MNISVVLVCDRCRMATLHLFADRRVQRRDLGEISFVDLIYGCEVCGTARPWGNEPQTETVHGHRLTEAPLTHAIDMHGMRREICAACRGVGFGCSECDESGESWVFDDPDPCGAACPITGLALPVAE